MAFYYAIEEINKDPHLLPNQSLGFQLYNAINSDHRTLENALMWFSGGDEILPNYSCKIPKRSVAVTAGTASPFSAQIGTLLELYRIPQVRASCIVVVTVWISCNSIYSRLTDRK